MKILTKLKHSALIVAFVIGSYLYFNSQSPVPEELSAISTEADQDLSITLDAEPVSLSIRADDRANAQR